MELLIRLTPICQVLMPSSTTRQSCILVVEDDPQVSGPTVRYLNRNGIRAELRETLTDATDFIADRSPPLVLLDLLLPDGNGLDLLADMQSTICPPAVIIMSSLVEDSDVIAGLRSGAIDYILKPFSLPILVERIKSCLRTYQSFRPTVTADKQALALSSEQGTVHVTHTELMLLAGLASAPGAVRRESLLDLWAPESRPRKRTVDYYIFGLRKKLAKLGCAKCIATERGGYSFNGQVQWIEGTRAPNLSPHRS